MNDIFVFRMSVLPGYITSIAQYQSQVLLNVDLTHKLIHCGTVLHLMRDIMETARNPGMFKERAVQKLVGRVVMTR